MGRRSVRLDRARLVNRLADHVHDAPKRLLAYRDGDGVAGVGHFLAAHEALGGVHGDGADGAFTEVLRYFQDEAVAMVLRLKRVQYRRQRPVELHVHNGACNLPYTANSSIAHLFIPQNRSIIHPNGGVLDTPRLRGYSAPRPPQLPI